MIPQFLCPTHHQHYRDNAAEALQAWDQWMTSGHRALLDQEPEQAFRYYGSSMEVADILMHTAQRQLLSPITPFERFQLAGQHLAELCQRTGHKDIYTAIKAKLSSAIQNQRHMTFSSFNQTTANMESRPGYGQDKSGRVH